MNALPQLLRPLHSDEYEALPHSDLMRAVAREALERVADQAPLLGGAITPFAYDRAQPPSAAQGAW